MTKISLRKTKYPNLKKKDIEKMSLWQFFHALCPKGDFLDYSIFLYIARSPDKSKREKKVMLEAAIDVFNDPEYQKGNMKERMKVLGVKRK